jgi:DNA-binding NtrC family response regulator
VRTVPGDLSEEPGIKRQVQRTKYKEQKRELSDSPDTITIDRLLIKEDEMSSAINWGAEELSSLPGAQASILLREAALDHRLGALREAALNLLTEVESLGSAHRPRAERSLRLNDEVKQFEIDLIRIALDRTHGNQTQAARLLGVKLSTLNTKIKKYQIPFNGHQAGGNDIPERENVA